MSTRKKLFLWISAFLGVWLFVAVFILGLPWRWAFERRVAEFKAHGEPVCAADLAPKPVPPEENGAPLLEAIWRDIGAYQAWKHSGALNSPNLTFLEMQDLIQTESARIKAGQNSPAPEPQSPSSSHLSREESDKLSACRYAKPQVHDLSQLLRAQPDLIDRLEAALSKPHFLFSLEYKFPAMDIREPLGCSRDTACLLADLSAYFLVTDDREKARRCRLMLLSSPQILNSSYSFEGSKAHVAMTGNVVSHLNFLCTHLTVKELEELQQAAQNMKAWSTSWQQMLANHRVWFIEVIQASPKYSSSENGFIPGPIYFLLHTGFRYYDGLGTFNDFDDAMSDPEYTLKRDFHSYMGKGLISLGFGILREKMADRSRQDPSAPPRPGSRTDQAQNRSLSARSQRPGSPQRRR